MKYLLMIWVLLMVGFPVIAQQDGGGAQGCVKIDTCKIADVLSSAGLPQGDIDEVCNAVESACKDGSLSVNEARKLIKAIVKKKVQYMQFKTELKEDLKASIDAMKSAVKEGVEEEEARSIVALTALNCIKNGHIGTELQTRVREAVQLAVQERADVISAKKKEAEAVKERAENMIRERAGELQGTTEQKEENRRIRK